MIKAILFDFDGTVADTISALREGVNLTMEQYGYPLHTDGDILRFINNGARELIRRAMPEELRTEILTGLVVLDAEYGEFRNYLESGGYSVIAETVEDIPGLKAIIDYEKHPCEWATKIGRTGFVSALYILNNDFSIMVYMPQAIAPTEIITELED
jgi:beta-phosphoglucomutase-like phosphatase (HAD superfamily)